MHSDHIGRQEACCRAEVDRVAVFATPEAVQEVTGAGLGAAHLCLLAPGSETRHLQLVATRGAALAAPSRNSWRPLHLAAAAGDVARARVLVQLLGRDQLDTPGFGEMTALHVAVMRGSLELVSLLVAAGAAVTSRDLVHFTPLHYAAWCGRDQVAAYLLTVSPAPCPASCVGDTPLHLACWRGHLGVARLLVERGAGVTAQDGEQHSPLHVAAHCGHTELLSLLTQPR